MSEFIYVNFQRAGAPEPYIRDVYVQLAKMDAKEAADYAGADVHFTYRIYTRQIPVEDVMLIQQQDLVIDTRVIDPKTNKFRQYRIISDPEPKTLMMSWQFIATRYRGT